MPGGQEGKQGRTISRSPAGPNVSDLLCHPGRSVAQSRDLRGLVGTVPAADGCASGASESRLKSGMTRIQFGGTRSVMRQLVEHADRPALRTRVGNLDQPPGRCSGPGSEGSQTEGRQKHCLIPFCRHGGLTATRNRQAEAVPAVRSSGATRSRPPPIRSESVQAGCANREWPPTGGPARPACSPSTSLGSGVET